jgi:CrcB protein
VTWQAAGWVAIGGAVGSVLRWAAILVSAQRFGVAFPWGTLFVNVVGSFLIGLVAEAALGGAISPTVRLFLATGILGGFTTFSAFSLDALLLARDGAPLRALLYAVVSVVMGVLCAYAGTLVARALAPH